MVALQTLRGERTALWFLLLAALIFAAAGPAPPARAADEPPAESAPEAEPAAEEQAPQDYYELYELLADALDQVERNYVKEVDRRKLVEAAVRGMLSELDPYSAYIDPEQLDNFRDTIEAEFGGIGAQVGVEDGRLKIISPLVGTPAYRAGLLAGDVIVEIDGESTEGFTLEEAVKRLKGAEGTQVTLTVVHPGRPGRETVTLTREIIHVETVLGDRRKEDDSWDFILDEEQGIGYVRLTAFSRDTASRLQGVIEQLRLQGLRALILDLRFNPGGLLRSAVEISDMFVSEGLIVSTEGRNSPQRTWKARRPGTYDDFPMVVLVNRYSASASEIVAACLQDHERAVVVGERTWGKGSVQNLIELEDGRSALKLTTAAYQRPSGKNIHRFSDDTEDDSWGVAPNEGFELRLGDSEIVGLVRDRRERDIVRPHTNSTGTTAESPQAGEGEDSESPKGSDGEDTQSGQPVEGTESPEPGEQPDSPRPGEQPEDSGPGAQPEGAEPGETPEASQPDAKPQSPEPGQPPERPQPGSGPAEDGEAAPAASPSGAEPSDPADEPPSSGDSPPTTAPDAQEQAGETAAEGAEPAFVDRQLEMALNYLWTELARADAAVQEPEE